jgi:hypothetical protein
LIYRCTGGRLITASTPKHMKKKILLFVAFTLLTFLMLTRVARAQFATAISVGVANPMRGTRDSVPGIAPGLSFKIQPSYNFGPRLSMNVTVGYVMLNTAHGFTTTARQYGYTPAKGFALQTHSGGMIDLGLGLGINVLPTGVTDCGWAKPSLILGVQGGALFSVASVEGSASTKEGVKAYSIVLDRKSTMPYYGASLQLLCPVSSRTAITTNAMWRRADSKSSIMQTSNGNATTRSFTYSDLQLSIGVQVAFKSINEKGVKRSVPMPSTEGQAMTEGSPIGGIVVKGGVNPGTKPPRPVKPSNMTEGQPIGGIVVKGGINPGTKPPKPSKPSNMTAGNPIGGIIVKGGINPGTKPPKPSKPSNMAAGNPIGGIIVKGGKNPGGSFTVLDNGNGKSINEKGVRGQAAMAADDKGITEKGMKTEALVYTDDFLVDNPTLLSYLGTDELVIEKGEYAFDYSENGDAKVILHLHSEGIVHRDIAARSFSFEGTDPGGKPFTYSIEPVYVDGVAKDILVTYKGITEKGIK